MPTPPCSCGRPASSRRQIPCGIRPSRVRGSGREFPIRGGATADGAISLPPPRTHHYFYGGAHPRLRREGTRPSQGAPTRRARMLRVGEAHYTRRAPPWRLPRLRGDAVSLPPTRGRIREGAPHPSAGRPRCTAFSAKSPIREDGGTSSPTVALRRCPPRPSCGVQRTLVPRKNARKFRENEMVSDGRGLARAASETHRRGMWSPAPSPSEGEVGRASTPVNPGARTPRDATPRDGGRARGRALSRSRAK